MLIKMKKTLIFRKILRKQFFITLLCKQNKHHRYSVLGHTLAIVYHTLKYKQFRMLPAAVLHDIGKPLVAYQDDKDIHTGEYSFSNHEEISYHIIKNWPLSSYTKRLVRYHYLIRGMQKAKEKKLFRRYKRMKRAYNRLDDIFIKDLTMFMKLDDLAKK